MTWTVSHTIGGTTGSGARASVFPYMFDTYLPSKGWNVTPHPSGDVEERSLSWTYTDVKMYPSIGSVTNYFWVDWNNSTYFYFYEDSTYTTTPGDLGTDGTNSIAKSINTNDGTWRFWTSSDDANASLVTRGSFIFWFWPGLTEFYGMVDQAWDGTYDTNTTTLWPLLDGNNFWMTNRPATTGDSSTKYPLIPEYNSVDAYFDKGKLINRFGMVNASGSTTEYPGQNTVPLTYMGQDDLRWYLPGDSFTTDRFARTAFFNILINNENWCLTNNGSLGYPCLAFKMNEFINF